MRTPPEIGAHAVALFHLATDQLAEFIGPSPGDDEAVGDLLFEAGKAVPKSDGRLATRQTWEEHGARNLIMAVGHVLHSTGPDENEEDPEEDGWAALGAGDLDAAAAAATRLLELASEVGEDDWNYGNLVHWGHIIRGHVRLREDDLPGAEAELIAAGRNPGSPQLDSFGPDLCLAWMLLKRGADPAVLTYLHDISRFWSPRRRCP